MSNVRIVKRYRNRKLYDTEKSSYVTLDDIARLMRDGQEVKVIDNKSKEDITFMTQVQLLFEREKKFVRPDDIDVLSRAVKSEHGTFTTYIRELENKLNLVDNSLLSSFVANDLEKKSFNIDGSVLN